MPDYDSHSDMLTELGIKDDYLGASKKFVRAEFSPADGDVFSPVDGWGFKVDQDITPEWFSEEEYKPRMLEAVKEWAKTHIHIGITGLKIDSGSNHYIKDCKDVEVYGNATVNKVYGNATVKWVCENATVNEVCENATVKWVYGNATVNEVCENATVKWVYENATVKWVCENATVASSAYTKWNNSGSLILSDNSTFKDNYGKVIYQSGDYKLISVESGKAIGEAK
jgi:hypothetical protein